MTLLVTHSGAERSEPMWRDLIHEAGGLKMTRCFTGADMGVVEVVKA